MDMIKKIAALPAALADGLIGGLFRAVWEAVTGRNVAAEQAEREDAEERQLAAQAAEAELEARHRETLAAAVEQAQALRELRAEMAVMAERRERHARFSRQHADEMELNPRRRRRSDPEPEDGAPMCPVPV